MIEVYDEQGDLPLSADSVCQVVEFALRLEGTEQGVRLYFLPSPEMGELHQAHFATSDPTDCISLPSLVEGELGEVFVCPAVAKEYVELWGGSVYREVQLYTLHGLLHLLGYRDGSAKARLAMRCAEYRHMEALDAAEICLKSGEGLS